MGSPRCTLNRWGAGTGAPTPTPTTEVAKELDDKLKKMMAERNKIDTLWTTPSTSQSSPNNSIKTDK